MKVPQCWQLPPKFHISEAGGISQQGCLKGHIHTFPSSLMDSPIKPRSLHCFLMTATRHSFPKTATCPPPTCLPSSLASTFNWCPCTHHHCIVGSLSQPHQPNCPLREMQAGAQGFLVQLQSTCCIFISQEINSVQSSLAICKY